MNPAEILAGIKELSALVVGDICLDRWCKYDPATAEPSRETGLPRIGVVSTEVSPGAGGTVANNLVALGVGRVSVLGAAGEDGFGYELSRAMSGRGIDIDLFVTSRLIPTFTYTKLINANTGIEDQPRVDFIQTKPVPESVESEIVKRLRSFAGAFDLILASDQAETEFGGIITPAMRDVLSGLGRAEPGKLIWVDSRMRTELFRHVIVKPNRDEAEKACARVLGRVDYAAFRRQIEAKLLFVTHGPDGVLVCDNEHEEFVPTRPVAKPVDICGAGDSFSAGAASALAVTGSPLEAARFGNLVASITIMKKGTGTASPDEVLAAAR
jgi:rfaE bifunctional protein kinase chain/domain